jgi:SAM-dependent methyltransferase
LHGELLRDATTHLPCRFSREALASFGMGKTARLLRELQTQGGTYERVGADRALAIAIDLACLGVPATARILDVGCSVGTIALLLSEIGYAVTGLDSDGGRELAEAWERQRTERCRLIEADLRTYLRDSTETYDVALLLSVLHHWLPVAAPAGGRSFGRDELRAALTALCGRVRRSLYVEIPIVDELAETPPDPAGEFLFPGWFLEAGLATQATLVASTIAANGRPRRLFRVDLS